MNQVFEKTKKIISVFLSIGLIFQQAGFAQVASSFDISGLVAGLNNSFTSDKFHPMHLRYFSYDGLKDNFELLLDKGDIKNAGEADLTSQTQVLFNYFLTGVTLPNDLFWVNLRPDQENNIIAPELEKTDIGKILLAADVQLKKDTAAFTSPETTQGRQYWDRLYQKAEELYGSTPSTIPTVTRPWIVPGEVIVRYTETSAYVYKATLKVMLEQDYLSREAGSRSTGFFGAGKDSTTYNFTDPRAKALNDYSSQLIRELILPELTKEINTSKRYASLRQVYYSLILAQWFKSRFNSGDSTYAKMIDRSDLTGLTSTQSWSKTPYFMEYQKSFKDGEYNIQEQVSGAGGRAIRMYVSGGIMLAITNKITALKAGFLTNSADFFSRLFSDVKTFFQARVDSFKNTVAVKLPAGKGFLNTVLGRGYRSEPNAVFTPDIFQALQTELDNPYSVLSVPFSTDENELKAILAHVEQHTLIVQPGNTYVKEGDKVHPKDNRTAALINRMWTYLLTRTARKYTKDDLAAMDKFDGLLKTGQFDSARDMLQEDKDNPWLLHNFKKPITYAMYAAVKNKDMKNLAQLFRFYVEIRDTLCKLFVTLALDASQEKTGLPDYAHDFAEEIFGTGDMFDAISGIFFEQNEQGKTVVKKSLAESLYTTEEGSKRLNLKAFAEMLQKEGTAAGIDEELQKKIFKKIRSLAKETNDPLEALKAEADNWEPVRKGYEKYGDEIRKISFYTFGPIGDIAEKAWKEGIAIFPVGAGGPGTVCFAISDKSVEEIEAFFRKNNINEFDEALAEKIISGDKNLYNTKSEQTLIGFMRFKAGTETIGVADFKTITETAVKLGLKIHLPEKPKRVMYNPATNKTEPWTEGMTVPEGWVVGDLIKPDYPFKLDTTWGKPSAPPGGWWDSKLRQAALENSVLNPEQIANANIEQIKEIIGDNALKLLRLLGKQGKKITFKIPLRGLDIGSSLDLLQFQYLLTPEGVTVITQLPLTGTLSSNFYLTLTFEAAEKDKHANAIVYTGSYFKPGEEWVREEAATVPHPDRLKRLAGMRKVPDPRDMPVYYLHDLMGLRGIKVTADIDVPPRCGGMESSNAFTMGLMAFASLVSGVKVSYADLDAFTVKSENDEFDGITGGQGQANGIIGSAAHVFLSGLRNALGKCAFAAFRMVSGDLKQDSLAYQPDSRTETETIGVNRQREISPEQAQLLNSAFLAAQAKTEEFIKSQGLDSLVNVKKEMENATLLLVPFSGYKKGHYSLGRNQLFVNFSELDEGQEALTDVIFHESAERLKVLALVNKLGLTHRVRETAFKPEQREGIEFAKGGEQYNQIIALLSELGGDEYVNDIENTPLYVLTFADVIEILAQLSHDSLPSQPESTSTPPPETFKPDISNIITGINALPPAEHNDYDQKDTSPDAKPVQITRYHFNLILSTQYPDIPPEKDWLILTTPQSTDVGNTTTINYSIVISPTCIDFPGLLKAMQDILDKNSNLTQNEKMIFMGRIKDVITEAISGVTGTGSMIAGGPNRETSGQGSMPKLSPYEPTQGDLTQPNNSGEAPMQAASTAPNAPGGIDFRAIQIIGQMNNNPALKAHLPSPAVLAKMDTASEGRALSQMMHTGVMPSAGRIMQYVAACALRKSAQYKDQALVCLSDFCRMNEDMGVERMNPEFTAFLFMIDGNEPQQAEQKIAA